MLLDRATAGSEAKAQNSAVQSSVTVEKFLHLLTNFECAGKIGGESGWRVSFVARQRSGLILGGDCWEGIWHFSNNPAKIKA